MAKLTAEQVAEIRREWEIQPRPSVERLGAKYNVSISTIASIVKGRTWKAMPPNPKTERVKPRVAKLRSM